MHKAHNRKNIESGKKYLQVKKSMISKKILSIIGKHVYNKLEGENVYLKIE